MNATMSLITLCFLVYGIMIFSLYIGIDEDFIFQNFGFSGENLFNKPWTLLTSIFMHVSIDHLLSNVFVMFFFGIAVESEIGKKKMLSIFFLGAIAGDLLSLLFYPPSAISIGASAGVFALIGVGMLVRPLDMSFYPPFFILPLGLLGILYAFYNAVGFLFGGGNISYIAHFGGLFIGLLFGMRQEGWQRGFKILLIMLLIMILIPIIWLII